MKIIINALILAISLNFLYALLSKKRTNQETAFEERYDLPSFVKHSFKNRSAAILDSNILLEYWKNTAEFNQHHTGPSLEIDSSKFLKPSNSLIN